VGIGLFSFFFSPIFKMIVSVLQCDLLEMPAAGQLERDAKYALVYQLLMIFMTQRLDAYLEFQAANSASLKSYGTTFALLFCFLSLSLN